MRPHPVIPLSPASPRFLFSALHLQLQGVALRPVLIQLLAQHVDLLLELPKPSAASKIRLRRLRLELLELFEELRILISEQREIRRRD
jgi:hypothetical protein